MKSGALLLLVTLSLTACDVAEMPPCSAVIVVGSVTYSCPRLPATTATGAVK